MRYELMTDADYEGLPEDPSQQFVAIEAICRRNLNRFIGEEDRNEFDDLLRSQYMMMISAAAAELGIQGIDYPHDADRPAYELDRFMVQVTGVVTRLRLRTASFRSGSVQIAAKTRTQIDVQIRRLRSIIENGDMTEAKRKDLLDRLDQLADEVAKSRLHLGRAMAILAFVGMGVASGTSFLADAPEALATITSLIGIDQAAEEAEQKRIGSPPPMKALPAPDRPRNSTAPVFEPGALDDDIPF